MDDETGIGSSLCPHVLGTLPFRRDGCRAIGDSHGEDLGIEHWKGERHCDRESNEHGSWRVERIKHKSTNTVNTWDQNRNNKQFCR